MWCYLKSTDPLKLQVRQAQGKKIFLSGSPASDEEVKNNQWRLFFHNEDVVVYQFKNYLNDDDYTLSLCVLCREIDPPVHYEIHFSKNLTIQYLRGFNVDFHLESNNTIQDRDLKKCRIFLNNRLIFPDD
ncbi:MAG: hypothetical protein LAT55_10320 [Opitutales bacterium]|nr:hypothetical protein [Opitutales bacterium]